jgi:hypothetical protein
MVIHCSGEEVLKRGIVRTPPSPGGAKARMELGVQGAGWTQIGFRLTTGEGGSSVVTAWREMRLVRQLAKERGKWGCFCAIGSVHLAGVLERPAEKQAWHSSEEWGWLRQPP